MKGGGGGQKKGLDRPGAVRPPAHSFGCRGLKHSKYRRSNIHCVATAVPIKQKRQSKAFRFLSAVIDCYDFCVVFASSHPSVHRAEDDLKERPPTAEGLRVFLMSPSATPKPQAEKPRDPVPVLRDRKKELGRVVKEGKKKRAESCSSNAEIMWLSAQRHPRVSFHPWYVGLPASNNCST